MKINIELKYQECIASAPCSTANLGPGFDVFGLGLDAMEDSISLKIIKERETNMDNVKIKIKGEGSENIPIDPDHNSSGRVARKIIAENDLYKYNCFIEIEKNIPAGYGIGSSAASAVATAMAFDKIFELNIHDEKLLDYAAEGEVASAGVKHYDNIAGSFFGNFVIVKTYPKIEYIKIKSPPDLTLVVCLPLIEVPKMKTESSRKVLPQEIPLKKMVQNVSNACTVVAGFCNQNTQMICSGINDCIIEPVRQKLIPGYEKIKERSIKEGALAFTISGAGPSTIAFSNSKNTAMHIATAMQEEYNKINIECKTFITKPSNGARIISIK